MSSSETEEDGGLNIFDEPGGFYQPEKQPTTVSHTTLSGQVLNLRLIGHSPLWGHHLWNAGRILATYLEEHASTLIKDKSVLELGAGAGLPSLICALNGAKHVVATDYPDADLTENLRGNLSAHEALFTGVQERVKVEGYVWGADVGMLKAHLLEPGNGSSPPPPQQQQGEDRFDLLILADLLFNHSEHAALLNTIERTLKKPSPSILCGAVALVFFTPYRPWLLEKDLAFFAQARASGFEVEKVHESLMERVMFEEDPGDEKLRRTVWGYAVRWPKA